ncbi:MAG: sigma-54 dependent transcriptional regulator [Planctomycetota bacterium]|jgi:DNA-binding NtrC family response regulator|nr:sigma-54 dependent transcriptional regulator [Planctomycetota bacterium]
MRATADPSAILIVDDMEKHAVTLARALAQHGYKVETAFDSHAAGKLLGATDFSLVLLDLRLGDEDGVDVLKHVRREYPALPVVMITAFGAVGSAVEALKLGAVDYLEKPLDMTALLKTIRDHTARTASGGRPSFITRDPATLALLKQAEKLAATDMPVLIQGESGAGKELLADAIHAASRRAGRVMIRTNCAAFPETLLDNELFGHEKGAFTGAGGSYRGLFEKADGGTLFLDEIGDMAPSTQSRILRVIQNREIWRIGGEAPVTVDVRFICATNRDLGELIGDGRFRRDLLFRLDACTLILPPLRERRSDIELLCRHFLRRFSGNGATRAFSPAAMEAILSYRWPGNVRELQNAVQFAASMAANGVIDADDLPEKLRHDAAGFDLRGDEKKRILAALRENGYRRNRTAESLRMNRATLYRKMRKHGLL